MNVPNKTTRWLFLGSIFSIVVAFCFLNTGNLQQKCASYLLYPLLVIERQCVAPVKNWLYWRRGVSDLLAVAQKLAQERDALLKKNIELEAVVNYLGDSAEARDFKQRYGLESAVPAQILLKNFSEQAHFFLVNAGSSKGIKKDMVAVYSNNLIGRVSEVYSWYSKVILVTDRDCHVAVKSVNTGLQGIHTGLNTLSQTRLNFVSHLDTVQKGDLVISHGDGLVFPRGFALGKITAYELLGVQYKVAIQPLIDLQAIDFCLLIDKSCRLN